MQSFKKTQTSQPCHDGIHWIDLAEYSQMSTHVPGVRSFSGFLHHFELTTLATSSIRVNLIQELQYKWKRYLYHFYIHDLGRKQLLEEQMKNTFILTLPMLRLLSSKAQDNKDI